MNIHDHIGKNKIRALILFPPTIIIVISLILTPYYILSDIVMPTIFSEIYLFAVAYFIIAIILVFWSDAKRLSKLDKKINEDK